MCEQVAAAIIIPPGNDSRVPAGVSALKACAAAGVKNVVLLSVDNVTHKDEIFGGQFAQIEAAAPKGTTIIRLPFFYENSWGDKGSIAGMGKIFAPVKAEAKGRAVAADDAGAALAGALEAPEKHGGKVFNVSSSIISKSDVAAAFSSALGKPVEYVQIPFENAKETIMGFGLLEWQVDGMFEIMRSHEAQAPYAVFDGSKDFTTLTGRSPTSLTEWVKGVVATGAFAPPTAEPEKPPAVAGSSKAGVPTVFHAKAASLPKPEEGQRRLFLKLGCPFCTKLVVFIADAGLQSKVKPIYDCLPVREYVAKVNGGKCSFPALELEEGKVVMLETDDIITLLKAENAVNDEKLWASNYFNDGMAITYRALFQYLVKNEGGYPKAQAWFAQHAKLKQIPCPDEGAAEVEVTVSDTQKARKPVATTDAVQLGDVDVKVTTAETAQQGTPSYTAVVQTVANRSLPPGRVRHLFKKLDVDGSGGLSIKEVTEGFAKEFGVEQLASHVTTGMQSMIEQHGTVSGEGKIITASKFSRFYAEVLFLHFDKDNSGTLELAEVQEALKQIAKPNDKGEKIPPIIACARRPGSKPSLHLHALGPSTRTGCARPRESSTQIQSRTHTCLTSCTLATCSLSPS